MSKSKSSRKRASPGKGRRARDDEPVGEGGPDEAAAFIAETAGDLVRLARSHHLDMLGHLLRMAELEAEEYLRLRGKQKLSCDSPLLSLCPALCRASQARICAEP